MQQKVFLKLFIKGKISPLFVCEIADDAEKTIKSLDDKLNDEKVSVIHFGQVCFNRREFRYYQIEYK